MEKSLLRHPCVSWDRAVLLRRDDRAVLCAPKWDFFGIISWFPQGKVPVFVLAGLCRAERSGHEVVSIQYDSQVVQKPSLASGLHLLGGERGSLESCENKINKYTPILL